MAKRHQKSKGTPPKKDGGQKRVRRSREWLEQEKVLKMEAMGCLLRSRILLENAERICERIDKQVAINPTELEWEAREKWYAEADRLDGLIRENEEAFKKLHEVYDDVCKRVNAFYGEEVMTPHEFESIAELCDEGEEEDSGDWWKKE